MININLESQKEDAHQGFGGKFEIKNFRVTLDAIVIELEPEPEGEFGRVKTRKWRSATIYMSLDELPQLVAAVVNQLDQFASRLQSTLDETGHALGRDERHIADSHGDFLYRDINWDRVRRMLSREDDPEYEI